MYFKNKKSEYDKEIDRLQTIGYMVNFYQGRLSRFSHTYIYAIKCPISKHVVYVGLTENPQTRKYQHFRNKGSLIGLWCRAMLSIGLTPVFEIIDLTYGSPYVMEHFYINFYKNLGQANHNRFHTGGKQTYSLYIDEVVGSQPKNNYNMLDNYLYFKKAKQPN